MANADDRQLIRKGLYAAAAVALKRLCAVGHAAVIVDSELFLNMNKTTDQVLYAFLHLCAILFFNNAQGKQRRPSSLSSHTPLYVEVSGEDVTNKKPQSLKPNYPFVYNDISFDLPYKWIRNDQAFFEIVNFASWKKLSNEQKKHLRKFLPKFADEAEEEEILKKILDPKCNFYFGSPLVKFYDKLQVGWYHRQKRPVFQYLLNSQRMQYEVFIRNYYSSMLKTLIVRRQKILSAVVESNPIPTFDKPRSVLTNRLSDSALYRRAMMRAPKVNETNYSSDDEDMKDLPKLCNTTFHKSSDDVATLSSLKRLDSVDLDLYKPVENIDLKRMLADYRILRKTKRHHTAFDFSDIDLEGIIARCGMQQYAAKQFERMKLRISGEAGADLKKSKKLRPRFSPERRVYGINKRHAILEDAFLKSDIIMIRRIILLFAIAVAMFISVKGFLLGHVGYECTSKRECFQQFSHCRFDRCLCQNDPKLHEHCQQDDDYRIQKCADKHATCVNGTCVCKHLYKEKDGACVYDEKKLMEPCDDDRQCTTPFTQCYQGLCHCRTGFFNIRGTCTPSKYYCPYGKPMMKGESVHYCEISYKRNTVDCPAGSYCVPISNWIQEGNCREDNVIKGFCCPKPPSDVEVKPICPFGFSVSSAASGIECKAGWMHVDTYSGRNPICCPRACPSGFILIGNDCYQNFLPPGAHCEHNQQCDCGVCVQEFSTNIGKTCTCKKGTLLLYGKCYKPECFYGDPAKDPVTNTTLSCSETDLKCPHSFICYTEFNLCCPLMPIYGQ
ncbi:Nuclear factor related to kappa-B-binding protein [Trichinella pseudospiralis]|uniref:Nuclear factor related to kappa-B-binding protein n=1 Tax=Trichinella pseudospiralis TaxID=6337 RepID=A0A0V1FIG8_TRIPS|nr:Nuclear factor related to kappa-B-binding protein [Trichinella pseudospiralis]